MMPDHLSSFQVEYMIFGGVLILSGLLMIVTYTVSYPWWRDLLGRMMVTYAVAEITMATLLAVTVVWETGPTWFRPAWFTLQCMIAGCFLYQTWTIRKLKRERGADDRPERG
jgi:hypothetical protein